MSSRKKPASAPIACTACTPEQKCRIHDVDPARINFNKPEVRAARPLRHIATELDNQIREREGFRNRVIEEGAAEDLLLAPNPMEETVMRHREPGFAYGFLSDHASRVLGTRGYEVVKDGNGEPVRLGTLVLGKIPEKVQQARQRKAEAESVERVQSIADEYGEKVRSMKNAARDMGLRVLEPGEIDGDYTNTETGRTVHIG
jgi:hypothetical protein